MNVAKAIPELGVQISKPSLIVIPLAIKVHLLLYISLSPEYHQPPSSTFKVTSSLGCWNVWEEVVGLLPTHVRYIKDAIFRLVGPKHLFHSLSDLKMYVILDADHLHFTHLILTISLLLHLYVSVNSFYYVAYITAVLLQLGYFLESCLILSMKTERSG